jgi:ketosteroid isomerase-like protein
MRAILVATLFGVGLAVSPAAMATSPGSSPEAEATLRKLLTAFENLDYDAFVVLFAEDATMFFPTPEPPQRFDGRAAISEHFRSVFAALRQGSSRAGPPYQTLIPEGLVWQVVSADTVIATFHLRNEVRIGRRTVVLNNKSGRWLVVHLHASNEPTARH